MWEDAEVVVVVLPDKVPDGEIAVFPCRHTPGAHCKTRTYDRP
jgi:hypothetical protein